MGSVDTAAAALWAAQSGSPEVGDWNGAGLSLARKLSAAVHARAERYHQAFSLAKGDK